MTFSMSRRACLWLIPVFLLLHNAEEALTFGRYLPSLPGRLPPAVARFVHVDYAQLLVALVLATVIPFLLVAWVARRPDRSSRLWFAVLLQVVVLLNVFSHLASALFLMHGYAPGLLTALLVNLPFSLYLLRRVVRERWMSRRALWWTVPAAVLVHGPLLAGLILLGGSLAGCSEAPRRDPPQATAAPPAAVSPPESVPARASTPVVHDSTWVAVNGPTLVAFYVLPTHADSAGEVDSALDDYGYYLAEADSSLRALGFRVQAVPSRTVHLLSGRDTTVFTVPPDSADIGYYFVAPGRAPTVFYGVQVSDELIEEARAYLHPQP